MFNFRNSIRYIVVFVLLLIGISLTSAQGEVGVALPDGVAELINTAIQPVANTVVGGQTFAVDAADPTIIRTGNLCGTDFVTQVTGVVGHVNNNQAIISTQNGVYHAAVNASCYEITNLHQNAGNAFSGGYILNATPSAEGLCLTAWMQDANGSGFTPGIVGMLALYDAGWVLVRPDTNCASLIEWNPISEAALGLFKLEFPVDPEVADDETTTCTVVASNGSFYLVPPTDGCYTLDSHVVTVYQNQFYWGDQATGALFTTNSAAAGTTPNHIIDSTGSLAVFPPLGE